MKGNKVLSFLNTKIIHHKTFFLTFHEIAYDIHIIILVVNSLLDYHTAKEEIGPENICPICRDDFGSEKGAKQLPRCKVRKEFDI